MRLNAPLRRQVRCNANEVVPLTHVGPDLSKQQANPASDDPRICKNIGYAVREGLLDFGEGFARPMPGRRHETVVNKLLKQTI